MPLFEVRLESDIRQTEEEGCQKSECELQIYLTG
jgi:hypothetical protein